MITLSIIGIIAAMTVPNLISSYRKTQAETGLRVIFSILSNTIKQAEANAGSLSDMFNACHEPIRDENSTKRETICFANNYLKPYLKYTKSCNSLDDVECFDEIYPKMLMRSYKNLFGKSIPNIYSFAPYYSSFRLNNGMIIGALMGSVGDSATFLVDINGVAGPNKTGTDVFYFTLREKRQGKLPAGLHCLPDGLDKETWCNDEYGYGLSCACLIQQNGWKIPDNYPVKKW